MSFFSSKRSASSTPDPSGRGSRLGPQRLAEFATRELRGRGIEIRTSTTIEEVGERWVRLRGGETIPTRTVAWTAGVKPNPVVARLGLPLVEGGRLDVDATMRVRGQRNVWAIGDAAAVPDPARKGEASPPSWAPAGRSSPSRTERSACSSTWAATRPSPARWGSAGAASPRGSWRAPTTSRTCRARAARRDSPAPRVPSACAWPRSPREGWRSRDP